MGSAGLLPRSPAQVTAAITSTAEASKVPLLDAASRLAVKGLISSGTAPTVTLNAPANAFGTSGVTFTLEAGSNDMAGTIIINTGPSPASGYAFIDLTFSATLPGNLPVVVLTLESHNANFGGGASANTSTAQVTSRTATFVRIFLNNMNGATVTTWAASTSDAYRVHYQIVNK